MITLIVVAMIVYGGGALGDFSFITELLPNADDRWNVWVFITLWPFFFIAMFVNAAMRVMNREVEL